MAFGRAGERGDISMSFMVSEGLITVGDGSITEFSLDMPMMSLPTGTAVITIDSSSVDGIRSDADGFISFSGFGGTSNEAVAFSIFVTSAIKSVVSQNTTRVALAFSIGSRVYHANTANMAIEGTSLDAIKTLLGRLKVEFDDRLSPNMKKPQDSQIWRMVDATLVDHLNMICNHSNYYGDYMFWTLDGPASSGVVLSSIEVERANSTKHLLVQSPAAATNSVMVAVNAKEPECTRWMYLNYSAMDIAGTNVYDKAPNILVDAFDNDALKEMGACVDDCWFTILRASGVEADTSYAEQVFGDKVLVRPFPNNTHKAYAVMPYVRNALMAGYGKVIQCQLFNTLGPNVGDVVKFVATRPNSAAGDSSPDPYYTDEYIVLSKTITKDDTVPVGLIGKTTETNVTDVIVSLTLASNHLDTNETSTYYKSAVDTHTKFNEAMKNG